jgi:hypothetical protein
MDFDDDVVIENITFIDKSTTCTLDVVAFTSNKNMVLRIRKEFNGGGVIVSLKT